MRSIDEALVNCDLPRSGNRATVSSRKSLCNRQWMSCRQALVQTEAQGGGVGSHTEHGASFLQPSGCRAASAHHQSFKLSPDSSSIHLFFLMKKKKMKEKLQKQRSHFKQLE